MSVIEPWMGSGPDARVSVPLHGVGGWLYVAYMIGAALLYVLPPLLAPVVCGDRSIVTGDKILRLARTVLIAGAAAMVALVAWRFASDCSSAHRIVSSEYEQYLTYAELCASGRACPLAGQRMGGFALHLGPLFFVLLSIALRISTDVTHLFTLLLVGHAAAAALAFLLGHRLLGAPWGIAVGLLFALSPELGFVYRHLTHAPLAPWPLAGFAFGLLYLARDGGAAPLAIASSCLATATQLHGIVLPYVPLLVAVALWQRRGISTRAWLIALAPWAFLYAPWVAYLFATHFSDVGQVSPLLAWRGEQQAFLGSLGSVLPSLTVLAYAAIAAILVWPGIAARDKRVAATIALAFGVGIAEFYAGRDKWYFRYVVVFFPFAPLAWCLGLRTVVRALVAVVASAIHRQRFLRALDGTLAVLAIVGLAVTVTPRLREYRAKAMRMVNPTSLDDLQAVDRVLERHGVAPIDRASRVHGQSRPLPGMRPADPRLVAEGRLARSRDDRGANSAAVAKGDREEVLVVAGCRAVPSEFARWQEVVPTTSGPNVVAGYASALARPSAELLRNGASRWRGELRLPLEDPTTDQFHFELGRTLPDLQPSDFHSKVMQTFAAGGQGELRVTTSLSAFRGERALVVAHDRFYVVSVTLGGAPLVRASVHEGDEAQHDRFLLPSPPAPIALAITLRKSEKLGGPGASDMNLPTILDIYDEPSPPCADVLVAPR